MNTVTKLDFKMNDFSIWLYSEIRPKPLSLYAKVWIYLSPNKNSKCSSKKGSGYAALQLSN